MKSETANLSESYIQTKVSVRDVLRLCDLIEDCYLSEVCQLLEATPGGIMAVKTAIDRRLYAVLEPSREEVLTRILNVLIEMSGDDLIDFLANFDDRSNEPEGI